MSGVWTERSIPMTDHECAVEALEEVGATILASNQNQIRIRINGQEWAMQKNHGRYTIRVNRRAGNSLNWMNSVGPNGPRDPIWRCHAAFAASPNSVWKRAKFQGVLEVGGVFCR